MYSSVSAGFTGLNQGCRQLLSESLSFLLFGIILIVPTLLAEPATFAWTRQNGNVSCLRVCLSVSSFEIFSFGSEKSSAGDGLCVGKFHPVITGLLPMPSALILYRLCLRSNPIKLGVTRPVSTVVGWVYWVLPGFIEWKPLPVGDVTGRKVGSVGAGRDAVNHRRPSR